MPTQTGNKIRCVLTSNDLCTLLPTVISNSLTFSVNIGGAGSADFYRIKYYPNPVRNALIIDSLKLTDMWESVDIIALDGKKIFSKGIQGQTKVSLNMSKLANALYVAVLRRKQGSAVYFKVII